MSTAPTPRPLEPATKAAGEKPHKAVKAKPSQKRFDAALADSDLDLFRGLGAWIDLFDMDLDADAYIAQMAGSGVRTLYLQTGRSNSDSQMDPRAGRWLVAAHEAGMKVVGWYLPFYSKPQVDLIRTLHVANYTYQGHSFDGVGVDIEYRAAVPGVFTWNRRVSEHLKQVRKALGPGYPLAAIPPTPLQMRVAPTHWAGFPWQNLGKFSDAILLMSYWSDRTGCPLVRHHCAYEFTAYNVDLTRQLIGRDDRIIHVIGGVGDRIGRSELLDFVRGAVDAAANGASIYDARTTRPSWWKDLKALRGLG